MTNKPLELLIITGMSGAGKTIAMQRLEDADVYCVDNLPPQLLPHFANAIQESEHEVNQVALAIDLRTLDFLNALPTALKEISQQSNIHYQILFLDANDQVLVQRYKQSRRVHPMLKKESPLQGIQKERELLNKVKQQATTIIDTSLFKPIQLKEKITHLFVKEEPKMTVNIMSFGFKYGIPLDADLVLDVRFMPNPFYDETLRPKTGKEKDVAAYVFQSDVSKEYIRRLVDFLSFQLPQYQKEGKQQLVIAIGCTGGKHRSVAVTEKISRELQEAYAIFTNHRDIGRE